jgi:Flp pilus assembly protein TadG
MSTHRPRQRHLLRRRRGNAIMFSLLTSMMVGFGALAVDVGYMRVTRTELSIAADAAAHAGVGYLRKTPGDYAADMVNARAKTVSFAALNVVNDAPVVLDPNATNLSTGDVVLGVYAVATGAFTPSTDADVVNAVQVRATAAGLGAIFAPAAFGKTTFTTAASAIAVRGKPVGAGEVSCFLPIALPYCAFKSSDGLDEEHATDDLDGNGIADLNEVEFKLQPATGDNLGWAGFSSSFGAADIKRQFTDSCAAGSVKVGDSVSLKNGDMGVLPDIATAIASSRTTWNTSLWGTQPKASKDTLLITSPKGGRGGPTSYYGNTIEGPAVLFTAGPEYCDADPATGAWTPAAGATVAGFAWVSVYDVVDGGGAATRTIRARVEVMSDREFGTAPGGPDFGVTASSPDVIAY